MQPNAPRQNSSLQLSDEAVKAKACVDAMSEMNDEIGSFDIYNIYDTCGGDSEMTHSELVKRMSKRSVQFERNPSSVKRHPQLTGALNDTLAAAMLSSSGSTKTTLPRRFM